MGHAQNGEVRDLRQPAADIDRIGQRRIVVAGQNHHRQAGRGQQRAGAVDQGGAETVGFEGVAGEEDEMGAQRPRRRQHRREPGRAVAAMHRGGASLVDMNVGAVDQRHLRGGNGGAVRFR